MKIRTMTRRDIPDGMRLKDFAGWNQTEADWERFLAASPEGCFVWEEAGRVVGTVTTIVYGGRFAWIGMVLVDPAWRARGIGTALLDRAIEFLDAARVPAQKLDATPEGKPLYAKRGFVSEFEIERWRLSRRGHEPARETQQLPNLNSVLALDAEVFGADRGALLKSIDHSATELTLAVESGGEVQGYTFGRHGSRADHLGPWVSRDEKAAERLLDEFLHRSRRETVFVDLVKHGECAERLLRARGFEHSRPLTRMFRGANAHPGRPELVCAVLGPEFG